LDHSLTVFAEFGIIKLRLLERSSGISEVSRERDGVGYIHAGYLLGTQAVGLRRRILRPWMNGMRDGFSVLKLQTKLMLVEKENGGRKWSH
jgi:hypothetical protein